MSVAFLNDAKARVEFRGKIVDKITRAFLIAMEEKLGYPLTVVQGCFNTGVSQSAGTHDLGGVIDLAAHDWRTKVRVAADLGAFAYHRPYLPGHWGEHIHFGIRNHPWMAEVARRQQVDWDARPPRDGLAGHRPLAEHYYHPLKKIEFNYDPKTELMVVPMTKVQKARDELIAGIHNIAQSAALLDDVNPDRVVARAEIDNMKQLHKDARRILKRLPLR